MKEKAKAAEENAINTETTETAIESLIDHYKKIIINGRTVACPFWMNYDYVYKDTPYYKYFPKGGKRSPDEIRDLIVDKLNSTGFDIVHASEEQIGLFFLENGVGVDCSGLVYQCLKKAYITLGGSDFKKSIFGVYGEPKVVSRIGVKDLILPVNSFPVSDVTLVRPADFINFGHTHCIAIINRIDDKISCVHASNEILDSGIHEFSITITNPSESIFHQHWEEYSMDGVPYNEGLLMRVKVDDGVKRLRIIEELYRRKTID